MRYITTMLLAAAVLVSPAWAGSVWDQGKPLDKPVEATVYRSPTCGCCGLWLKHMKQQGFIIKDIKTEAMDKIKAEAGVAETLRSCHTALIDGYVVEGHVPAADVKDLLAKRPAVAGLAVPGMVSGTPGMEMGGRKDPFTVVEFDKKGGSRPFHDYRAY